MAKMQLKPSLAIRPAQPTSSVSTHDISPDDVLAALLDLFAKLKIGAADLASRIRNIDPKLLAAHRFYAHSPLVGEMLSQWHQNPSYLDENGEPIAIKLRGKGETSFYKLARSAVPTLRPAELLLQLRNVGAVVVDDKNKVHVRMRSLPVYKDDRLARQHTLLSLQSFIRTLRHNLDSDPQNSDQLFHRVAWNGFFDKKLIPSLKIKLKRQGQDFLESFDNWMIENNRKVNSRRRQCDSVFIGVYLAVGNPSPTAKKKLRAPTKIATPR